MAAVAFPVQRWSKFPWATGVSDITLVVCVPGTMEYSVQLKTSLRDKVPAFCRNASASCGLVSQDAHGKQDSFTDLRFKPKGASIMKKQRTLQDLGVKQDTKLYAVSRKPVKRTCDYRIMVQIEVQGQVYELDLRCRSADTEVIMSAIQDKIGMPVGEQQLSRGKLVPSSTSCRQREVTFVTLRWKGHMLTKPSVMPTGDGHTGSGTKTEDLREESTVHYSPSPPKKRKLNAAMSSPSLAVPLDHSRNCCESITCCNHCVPYKTLLKIWQQHKEIKQPGVLGRALLLSDELIRGILDGGGSNTVQEMLDTWHSCQNHNATWSTLYRAFQLVNEPEILSALTYLHAKFRDPISTSAQVSTTSLHEQAQPHATRQIGTDGPIRGTRLHEPFDDAAIVPEASYNQELLGKIPPDERVSELGLTHFAKKVDDWTTLAGFLGLEQTEINRVKFDPTLLTPANRITTMLIKWKRSTAPKDTWRELATACLHCNDRLLVVYIQELVEHPKMSEPQD